MEEEQAKAAAIPFVKWMSNTFAMAAEQQRAGGGTSPPSMARV